MDVGIGRSEKEDEGGFNKIESIAGEGQRSSSGFNVGGWI